MSPCAPLFFVQRWCTRALMLGVFVLLLVACAEDAESYPDLLTEMADINSDHAGRLNVFVTDGGRKFYISNTNISLHRPDTVYRAVVGYVPTHDAASSSWKATIYTLQGVQLLCDSTAVVRHDPTRVESMWQTERYINMQLAPLTQGGTHHWGYAVDTLLESGVAGRQHAHHHLSLHHNQCGDPLSFSETHYCSILLSSLPHYQTGDTVSVRVHTFDMEKVWAFY